tara:strand:+ start:422 stop:748 length:327 start_codon:yes stop_codon:yes gene_type:complete
MSIPETNYTAREILEIVDGGEFVIILRDTYLVVWDGGSVVNVHDLTDPKKETDYQVLPMFAPRCMLTVHDAIDDYFMELDQDKEEECLTTAPIRVIVETESNDPPEVN